MEQVTSEEARLLRRYGPGHRQVAVCFHHAGGGMSSYRGWADRLRTHVDVVLVQLKGREDRTAEPLTDDLGELAVRIARGICEMPYDEILLVGHSMGATVAWAVADAMWAVYRRRARVVLSAQAPPPYTDQVGRQPPPADHDRPAEDPGACGDTLASAADAFHARLLAADLAWMAREFPALVPRPLPVDVHCLAADRDPLLAPGDMAGWASLTTRRFSRRTVPGGHMYLLTNPEPVLDLVGELAVHGTTDRVIGVVH
ncbi:alpha/beta fold hydrolase [Streptomyces violaceochromogenes]|uniref:Alpha/beta fold hydrolase n=1 Tax=Streptomyces violaceochromogenes TaxID=67377 RepID=A0ABU6LRS4_9ACTN|nr:alpha/beta fold hydrolase [Streptomyces violaceochromogenes]MEC7052183.1 alpha/beta fold hydrolase [Streptomyces violaceochromogenes]GHC81400.1 thioesterase [Streptomyces violaceochromogenes]